MYTNFNEKLFVGLDYVVTLANKHVRSDNYGLYELYQTNYVFKENIKGELENNLSYLESTLAEIQLFFEKPVDYRKCINTVKHQASLEFKEKHLPTNAKGILDKALNGKRYRERLNPESVILPKANFKSKYSKFKLYFEETICEIITAIACIEFVLEEYASIPADDVIIELFSNQYSSSLANMISNYGWYRVLNMDIGCTEELEALSIEQPESKYLKIKVNVSNRQIRTLLQANVDYGYLNCNGKKAIVTELEKVQSKDILEAAKKIKTVPDTSLIHAFKIIKGCTISNINELTSYWYYSAKARDKSRYFKDIEGYYLLLLKDNNSRTIEATITSSLGRGISSLSKKLQNQVISQLNLDDLSF